MVKDFKYRGLSLEELAKKSNNDLEKVLNARARRSLKRVKDYPKKVIRAIDANVLGKETKIVKTHRRDILVLPKMVGLKFSVYDGKEFVPITIVDEMIGFYLGEFIDTRKRPKHSKAGIGATKSSKHTAKK